MFRLGGILNRIPALRQSQLKWIVGATVVCKILPITWFIRFLYYLVSKSWPPFCHLDEELTTYHICLPTDLDIFSHRKTGHRYFKELDFARLNFYFKSGMIYHFGPMNLFQHNAAIRFRRPLYVFTPYKVTTRLVWFEKKSYYFEHRFITLHDGYIRGIAWAKNTLAHSSKDFDLRQEMKNFYHINELQCPAEIQCVEEAHQFSSAHLRKILDRSNRK